MDLLPAFSTAVLSQAQVERLARVILEPLDVHGMGNFPVLRVRLLDFIPQVIKRIPPGAYRGARLNGGLASYILSPSYISFNDIDLIFDVDLSSSSSAAEPSRSFEVVRTAVLDTLLLFFPAGAQKTKLSHAAIQNAYIRKLVKVTDGDVWSLVSLNNDHGRCLDLKFVDRMRRQFEFSVDSFQIELDPVLAWLQEKAAVSTNATELSTSARCLVEAAPCKAGASAAALRCWDAESIISDSGHGESEHDVEESSDDSDLDDLSSFFSSRSFSPAVTEGSNDGKLDQRDAPLRASAKLRGSRPDSGMGLSTVKGAPVVWAESKFGNFGRAMQHLEHRLIDTIRPEEIRGGGLLKYCKLLAMGYKPAKPKLLRQAEKYMCSRFFIDFPDVSLQYQKLSAYLNTHFSPQDDPGLIHDYLRNLHRVIANSTVCLMCHERQMTLSMLEGMARRAGQQIRRPIDELAAAHVSSFGQCAREGRQRDLVLYMSSAGSYWLPLDPGARS